MAENKKSFIFYSDWIGTFKALPKDKAYDLLMHLLSYVNDENPQTNDPILEALFSTIKSALKRDLKKWEQQQEQRKEAGRRSAEIRKQNATVVNGRSISSTVNGNVNGNVKDDDETASTPSSNLYTIHEFEKLEIGNNEFTLFATRQSGKTQQQVSNYFDKFISSQKALNKLSWPNEPDAKKHFISWLKKQQSPSSNKPGN